MQVADLAELVGAMLFSGNALMGGLMLTGMIVMILMSLVSMAKPPPIAYVFIIIMGILMSMGMGWLDYYLAVLLVIVCGASIAWKISDGMRD